MLTNLFSSGLARTFGRAAFARPAAPVARAAFQPLRTNGLPSLRKYATEASQTGKIHQVIGAVVDGMFCLPCLDPVIPIHLSEKGK